jgi:hypothetical protein
MEAAPIIENKSSSLQNTQSEFRRLIARVSDTRFIDSYKQQRVGPICAFRKLRKNCLSTTSLQNISKGHNRFLNSSESMANDNSNVNRVCSETKFRQSTLYAMLPMTKLAAVRLLSGTSVVYVN